MPPSARLIAPLLALTMTSTTPLDLAAQDTPTPDQRLGLITGSTSGGLARTASVRLPC